MKFDYVLIIIQGKFKVLCPINSIKLLIINNL